MNGSLQAFDAPAPLARGITLRDRLSWSLRRELWENRFVVIAPLSFAAFVAFASLIHASMRLGTLLPKLSTLDPAKAHVAVVTPFSVAAAAVMFSTFVTGWFYAVDALHGERRDRSILFWKSLPLSDVVTVLTKFAVPLIVLPAIAFALALAIQAFLIAGSSTILLMRGISPAPIWSEFEFVEGPLVAMYGLAVHALWTAPIYGWLLLVSAWARRAPFVWAILPFVTAAVVEQILFSTAHLSNMLQRRFTGAIPEAFGGRRAQDADVFDRLSQLTPLKFLTSPSLWIGLILAALFVGAAIRLRRLRMPL
jgi:ABC-2 type transport system permease protein